MLPQSLQGCCQCLLLLSYIFYLPFSVLTLFGHQEDLPAYRKHCVDYHQWFLPETGQQRKSKGACVHVKKSIKMKRRKRWIRHWAGVVYVYGFTAIVTQSFNVCFSNLAVLEDHVIWWYEMYGKNSGILKTLYELYLLRYTCWNFYWS